MSQPQRRVRVAAWSDHVCGLHDRDYLGELPRGQLRADEGAGPRGGRHRPAAFRLDDLTTRNRDVALLTGTPDAGVAAL